MKGPKASVLIPVCNGAPWLAAAIESALAQDWPDTEVIVVDDGSSDASAQVAEGYASPKLRVIRTENRGSSAARNTALDASQGEYVQYLDADDLLSVNKVSAQMGVLLDAADGMLATCPIVYFEDGAPEKSGTVDPNLPFAGDSDDPMEFLLRLYGERGQGGMLQTSQWLTPRAVAAKAGPWDEAISVDNDGEYFARVVAASAGVRYCPQATVYYRKHTRHKSLSGAWENSESKVRSGIAATDVKARLLLERLPRERVARALTRSYLDWAWMAYPRFPEASAEALEKARSLCGSRVSPLLSAKGRAIQRIAGWRFARRMQHWWHSP